MPDVVVRLCIALLASVFAWSTVAKIVRMKQWRRAVAGYQLGTLEGVPIPGVPLVEAATVAVLLLAPARAAAVVVAILLGLFSVAILRARSRRGQRLPCGCFGRTKERDFRFLLVRNATLALVAAVILLFGEGIEVVDVPAPSSTDLLPVVLSLLGIVIGALTALSVTRSFRKGRG